MFTLSWSIFTFFNSISYLILDFIEKVFVCICPRVDLMLLLKQFINVMHVSGVWLIYWIYQKAIESIGVISAQVHLLNLWVPYF